MRIDSLEAAHLLRPFRYIDVRLPDRASLQQYPTNHSIKMQMWFFCVFVWDSFGTLLNKYNSAKCVFPLITRHWPAAKHRNVKWQKLDDVDEWTDYWEWLHISATIVVGFKSEPGVEWEIIKFPIKVLQITCYLLKNNTQHSKNATNTEEITIINFRPRHVSR